MAANVQLHFSVVGNQVGVCVWGVHLECFVLQIAFVQLQWDFIFVGAQIFLAQFHQLFDFGFVGLTGW